MKKAIKKALSVILVVVIMLTAAPLSGFVGLQLPEWLDVSVEAEAADKTTIQIGDYITLGTYYGEPIVWRCVDIDENGPLMLSDKILCLKAFDANGEDNIYHSDGWGYIRKRYGSNCWSDSSIRQWLNTSGPVEYTHCPPTKERVAGGYNAYDTENGFLTGFSDSELSMIKSVTQKCYINSYETSRIGYCDGGTRKLEYSVHSPGTDYSNYYYQNVTDKFFFLNPSQIDSVYNDFYSYLLYAYPTKMAVENSDYKGDNFSADLACSYWLGVAGNTGASYEHVYRITNIGGPKEIAYGGAYSGTVGVRPAFYLNTDNYSGDTDTELFFGADENSFGEDITGYVGDEIEAVLIYKNSEHNISALDISSSNTDIVEIENIRIGSGDYNNEVERDAYVTLKLKSAGNSTITITSPEGISERVNVIVNESSYEMKLYCEIPVMTVAKGDSIGAALQLEKKGTVYTGKCEYSFAVSNPSVLSVSGIREENNTVLFSINGLNEGLSKLTITEVNSGVVYSATVQVTNGVLTFNAEALPSYYDKKFEYNGYIGGMYIDEFKVGQTKNGKTDISFNVYNSSCVVGVVDIYDATGKLYKSEPIERFDGGYVTGIGDTLWNGWRMLEDLAKGELLTYKQESYSKKTPISIQVPAGGRIEITNDIQYSDTCAILNASEFAITTLLLFSETITNIKDVKPIAKESSLAILKSCALEKIPEIGNEFKEALMTEGLKQLTVDGITSGITDVTNSCVAVFDLFEIDFTKIVLKCAKDVGIGIAEEAFQKATSIYGAILDGMFTFSKYCDLSSFIVQLSKQRINHALAIYLNDENGCLVDNGTTVKPEDENASLGESNFVLHSVVLSKDKDISPEMKQSLDEISSEYVIRNIYMERDGIISQPGQTVQVYIPVPDNYNPANCTLYWVKEDGSLEKVAFTVIGNNIVFKTNHFSYWAIVHNADGVPVEPEYNYTFSIQTPSRTEIRNKDGIILHANIEGNAPAGSYVKWESSNGNFTKDADGSNLEIIAKNKGYTTFTAILCDADGNELARGTVEMYSNSGFFQKIGGFFRGLFGLTKIYEK